MKQARPVGPEGPGGRATGRNRTAMRAEKYTHWRTLPTSSPTQHRRMHRREYCKYCTRAASRTREPLDVVIDECSCIDLHGAHLYDVARGESIATAARPALSALSKGEDVDSSVRWLHPSYTFRPTAQIPREQVQGEQL